MIPRPFLPVERYDYDEHADETAIRDWMLQLVDKSPNRLAVIAMPAVDDDELDDLEALMISVYDSAKADRPNLSVKILHGVDTGGPQDGASRVVLAIHEHQWVAGQCVNGCPDTRNLDS